MPSRAWPAPGEQPGTRPVGAEPVEGERDDLLAAHLRAWLGQWPGRRPGLDVVGSTQRLRPGWDGQVHPVLGVRTPGSGVLSVPRISWPRSPPGDRAWPAGWWPRRRGG